MDCLITWLIINEDHVWTTNVPRWHSRLRQTCRFYMEYHLYTIDNNVLSTVPVCPSACLPITRKHKTRQNRIEKNMISKQYGLPVHAPYATNPQLPYLPTYLPTYLPSPQICKPTDQSDISSFPIPVVGSG